jgi:hypothetical protein
VTPHRDSDIDVPSKDGIGDLQFHPFTSQLFFVDKPSMKVLLRRPEERIVPQESPSVIALLTVGGSAKQKRVQKHKQSLLWNS